MLDKDDTGRDNASDRPDNASSRQHHDDENIKTPAQGSTRTLLGRIFWTPPWCRYHPDSPPQFSIFQNVLFAFAGAFTVANLYYNQPILNVLAAEFNVSYLKVSRIPTLMQSGYAVGLLLICPLGDLFPRRPYTLILVGFTATLWLGLCITKNFMVFLIISFITSVTTVTPQIMLPLVGELAPPHKRPMSLSIVVSGNLLGIVIARILAGVVTNYTNWRNIYWIALGLQYIIFIALYLFMPAYPSTNPLPSGNRFRQFLKAYPKLLYSMLQLVFKYPVLVQAGAVSYCISVSFTCFWTTLTFLLSGSPYNLAPTPIGLFGLIGLAAIFLGPFYAKYIIQPLKVPLYSAILGLLINLTGCCIGTYTGTVTLAGPVIQAMGLDAGFQIAQIALRTAIYSVASDSRNRVNTVFMIISFFGQITGTSAGNKIYDHHGGWRRSGSLGVAAVVAGFVVVIVRGPWEHRWFGWGGGWGKQDNRTKQDEEASGESKHLEDSEVPGQQLSQIDERRSQGTIHKSISRTRIDRAALTRQQSHGSDGHAMYGDDTCR